MKTLLRILLVSTAGTLLGAIVVGVLAVSSIVSGDPVTTSLFLAATSAGAFAVAAIFLHAHRRLRLKEVSRDGRDKR